MKLLSSLAWFVCSAAVTYVTTVVLQARRRRVKLKKVSIFTSLMIVYSNALFVKLIFYMAFIGLTFSIWNSISFVYFLLPEQGLHNFFLFVRLMVHFLLAQLPFESVTCLATLISQQEFISLVSFSATVLNFSQFFTQLDSIEPRFRTLQQHHFELF